MHVVKHAICICLLKKIESKINVCKLEDMKSSYLMSDRSRYFQTFNLKNCKQYV